MKKLSRDLAVGLTADYGEYTAVASSQRDINTGELGYVLRYHKGEMPSFYNANLATLAELESAMRIIQPDLRRWRLCRP